MTSCMNGLTKAQVVPTVSYCATPYHYSRFGIGLSGTFLVIVWATSRERSLRSFGHPRPILERRQHRVWGSQEGKYGTEVSEISLFPAAELSPGEMRLAKVEGAAVIVSNVDGELFAVDSVCPHQGAPLEDGELSGYEIECPWHFAIFDVRTGECVEGLLTGGLRRYDVSVNDNGDVVISMV